MANHNGNLTPRTMIGVGLIIVAVLLFFNNIGLKFVGIILSNWPIAFIVAGGVMLKQNKKSVGRHSKTLPYFLIAVGVLFLLTKHHVIGLSVGAIVGPLVLLFVGMHFLRPNNNWGKFFFNSHNQAAAENGSVQDKKKLEHNLGKESEESPSYDTNESTDSSTKIDVVAILGGGDFSTRSQELTGGSVIAILGGGEIDIRTADTPNREIEIDVLAFMGGVELKVPPHWDVTVKVLPFLGGVSNKTTCLADKMNVPKKHLIVTGLAFMGGVDIRN